MSCKRCTQRMVHNYDEMKCISCGFTIDVKQLVKIKPMVNRYLLPYIGAYPALRGRQMEYKYKQVVRQQTFETGWGNNKVFPKSYTVPIMFLTCPYCDEEVRFSSAQIGSNRRRYWIIDGETYKRSLVKCSLDHRSHLIAKKDGELIGWQ